MTAYDLRAKSTAARMLAPVSRGGKGQVVTLQGPATGGAFNAATDTTTGAGSSSTHQGSGVEEAYSTFTVASGAVKAGDVKFLLSPLKTDGSAMPEPAEDAWTLTKADGVWTVKQVDVIRPAGNTVMYTLRLRRGG